MSGRAKKPAKGLVSARILAELAPGVERVYHVGHLARDRECNNAAGRELGRLADAVMGLAALGRGIAFQRRADGVVSYVYRAI